MKTPWVKVTAALDQDQAEADTWWRNSTWEDRLRVWFRIQQQRDDLVDEIITRMAQNEFLRLAINNETDGEEDQ